MKRIQTLLIGAICLVLIGSGNVLAQDAASNEVTAKELATLFRAARKVISVNQGHINDASIGDKGLSADAVAAKAKENYKAAAGSDLPTGEKHTAMLDAVKDVMNSAQPLINEEGKGFKGFLPAVFAKQVADSFTAKMANKVSIKLTAPKEYVRNRANRPDAWEANIIESKFKASDWTKNKSFSETADVKGTSAFRFILPEYYGESCLKCHGEPAGELDITGGKKEGGKLGELGGAISVVLY